MCVCEYVFVVLGGTGGLTDSTFVSAADPRNASQSGRLGEQADAEEYHDLGREVEDPVQARPLRKRLLCSFSTL